MVWIIGNKGMLGTQVCRTLSENKIDFLGTDSDVSILDYTALEGFAAGKKISFIVNCAAYTAVDKAESETEKARALNADGPRNIARLAKKLGVPFIHISTDYVFDGTASSPISEDAPIKPIGVYGETKAEGEKAISEETDDFYILRTAWLYGWSGKNFVYTMIRAMNSHDSVKVVNDQKGTPTNCVTLANVILRIIGKRAEGESVQNGIYHVTDLGEITWFDFAKEIFAQGVERGLVTNRGCAVNPCATEEYPTPAKRPAYSVLDKTKVQRTLGITLPDWKDSLAEFLRSESFDNERIR
ncbi:dTDP-4-dehydrorhamnose reductase [Treponema saccharophilum]|uniref:dTDP-4-dehydrorhamnose reductase n=1 Tax=Treponema saccharophilum DSM 2985 TaxID=907348 RepID=H7EI26_9SPIR|nr:dTDP-4-dehydrorhamnose reductase [Treponema saccharophilum]EIC02705.1 dTDP-4-dehydrorhamnose reductase [Treponema saccharophilum DSM 2985]BDC96141.1 NAD(P)-dependent oxidoreductase [Treponema saccharophilum]